MFVSVVIIVDIYSNLTFNFHFFLLTRSRDKNRNGKKRYVETEFEIEIEIENFIISGSNLFQTVRHTYTDSENIRHAIER